MLFQPLLGQRAHQNFQWNTTESSIPGLHHGHPGCQGRTPCYGQLLPRSPSGDPNVMDDEPHGRTSWLIGQVVPTAHHLFLRVIYMVGGLKVTFSQCTRRRVKCCVNISSSSARCGTPFLASHHPRYSCSQSLGLLHGCCFWITD